MTNGEKRAIREALKQALRAGFVPVSVFDGERSVKGACPVMTDREVIDACASVDDSHINFKNERDYRVPVRAWARVILGNASDGSEVIADNSTHIDAFDKAMSRAMGI